MNIADLLRLRQPVEIPQLLEPGFVADSIQHPMAKTACIVIGDFVAMPLVAAERCMKTDFAKQPMVQPPQELVVLLIESARDASKDQEQAI